MAEYKTLSAILISTLLLGVILPSCIASYVFFKDAWNPARQDKEAVAPDLVQVSTDRQEYGLGDMVIINVTVTNVGSDMLTFRFTSTKQADFTIYDSSEGEIYTDSKHKMYATVLTIVTLHPGELKTYIFSWNQRANDGNPVQPGTYFIVGELDGISSPRVSITIT